MSTPVGTWAPTPPTAPPRERSEQIDADVADLQAHPGLWKLIDRRPGRSGGPASSYRARGCHVTTRHHDGHTDVWACWPAPNMEA